MTRLIDNMERQHLVVRISDKRPPYQSDSSDQNRKRAGRKGRIIANRTLKEALHGITVEELSVSQEVLRKIFFNTKD